VLDSGAPVLIQALDAALVAIEPPSVVGWCARATQWWSDLHAAKAARPTVGCASH
jgi:hypothetical protein